MKKLLLCVLLFVCTAGAKETHIIGNIDDVYDGDMKVMQFVDGNDVVRVVSIPGNISDTRDNLGIVCEAPANYDLVSGSMRAVYPIFKNIDWDKGLQKIETPYGEFVCRRFYVPELKETK